MLSAKRRKTGILLAFIVILAMLASTVGSAFAQYTSDTVRVLITFDAKPGLIMKNYIERYGVKTEYDYQITPTIMANVPRSQVKMIRALTGVASVEYDSRVWALDEQLPWGVDRIDAEIVHSYNKGAGVKVAVVDSGIDVDHPDLHVLGGKRFYDQGSEDDNYGDAHGHGTHVAGIIAALDNEVGVIGVAPDVDLYSVRVLASNGSGYWSDVIKGIEWSITNGMDVINMSLGGSSSSTALENACNAAEAAGIVVIAAAGNSGNRWAYGDNVLYPAKYNSVIAVAATDSSDLRASFSSTGSTVELAAPGVNIRSTCNGGSYCTMSGTSMASPHVAGLAALIIASGVTDTNSNGRINDEVRQLLCDTADDLGPAGRDVEYGYGIVDADEAVTGPANAAPVAQDDDYGVDEDADLTVIAPGVLDNDSDDDGDPLEAIKVTDPDHGSLSLASDGSFTYDPVADFNGTDSFTYKANDGKADSNTATVTITVNPTNDTPTAFDDFYGVDVNGSLNVPVDGVLGNDDDIDGDSLQAQLVDDAGNGTLTLNADGSFSYTPDVDFEGTDTFTYQAYDGTVTSNTATVTVTVSPVNYPPAATDDDYSVNEDDTLIVAAPGVLGNDNDPNGDSIDAIEVSGPSHGSLTLNADGSFTYDPTSNYHGSDSFTYKANDGEYDSNIATVNITVDPVNDAPAAVDDSFDVDMDETLNIPAPGVLVNDTDQENDPLHANLVSGTTDGDLTLNPDGSFVYTPDSGFEGQDSFTYQANDGTDNSNVATVTINVLGVIPGEVMYIESIDMILTERYSGWIVYAEARVTIKDGTGAYIEGAEVSGHWEDATHDSDAGITNAGGYTTVRSDISWRPSAGTTFTFVVDNVQKDGIDYDSSANNETYDSISL